jgi:hypothetical protein
MPADGTSATWRLVMLRQILPSVLVMALSSMVTSCSVTGTLLGKRVV